MRARPHIFLVSGIPGAGKTTVSRLLAARFEHGVHIEVDALQALIVRGALWPNEQPPGEAQRLLALRATNAAMLAANFFDHDFTVVVDDVIVGKDRLRIYRRLLHGRPSTLVVLAPPLEVVLARDERRGYKHTGGVWAHLDHEQRTKLGDVGIWVDSAEMTPDETVAAILAAA